MSASPDGFACWCKDCASEYMKSRNNPVVEGPKTCSCCGVTYEKGQESFNRHKVAKDGLCGKCKTCDNAAKTAWNEANPISVAVSTANATAKSNHGLEERLDLQEVVELFDSKDHKCEYCGCDGRLGLDHVIPFSRGGGNTIDNVVPCCPSCNFEKNDKTPEEYQEYLKGDK
jgi:5-methylcytosine-specific restriction endonuclease McrA